MNLRAEILTACKSSGRPPDSVKLLAVSKAQNMNAIKAAYSEGQLEFGESYLQEAKDKITQLPNANWHYIGAIQSKKTKEIANKFSWVHSIDSEKVARRLSEQRENAKEDLKILIQVNISRDKRKRGVMPEEISKLARKINSLPRLCMAGLMAIPSLSETDLQSELSFRELKQIGDQLRSNYGFEECRHLSMGMSADFVSAIREGATWIRIGSKIFGMRIKEKA
tara:strand:- start:63 stop:734 length:672 start_codon:yes stop_codon:yes gene_type:complete